VQASSGASTYDVAGILSNVANKSLKQGFLSVESSWREIASIQPVRDLKKTSSYALSGDFSYQPVARGGEVKHASMSEEKYENQASTKAILFTIDEDDLINDDLSAFSRVRRLLGRGAAQSLNNVIWEKFLSGVSSGFWGASRNNLITGAASALDVDSLSNARTLFSKQTDPDGAPMGMSPKLLVVPTELEIQADRLVGDREIRIEGATAKTTYTTGNPHAGKFRVVSSAYLNNDLIPNGSATHWFLLGDPMDFATIEVVFLNGQQFPRIENVSLDANQLGIGMRAVHRFGAELHEHRASVMSAGA
jgi:phage major head subunit gpT-like protein